MKMISGCILFICLAAMYTRAYTRQAVPALLWSPERSMSDLPDVTGMNTVNSDDFLKSYLDPVMNTPSESSVVFLQDKLHVDDFTQFADVYSVDSDGGAFKNIKDLMDNHFSLELPQVSDPLGAIKQLKEGFSGEVHTVTSAKDVEKLGLTAEKKFLLVVQLAPVTSQKDKENTIKDNDAIIGEVNKYLQKRGVKYSALFTGEASGESQADNFEAFRQRHLLAEPSGSNATGAFMNVSNMFIFLKEVFVCVKNTDDTYCKTNFTLVPDENTANSSSKENSTASIVLQFNGVSPKGDNNTKYNIKFVQEVHNQKDRWNISRSTLDVVSTGSSSAGNTSLKNAPLSQGDMDFVIPILYSYHCSEMIMAVDALHAKNFSSFRGSYINLTGYQIQPFNIQQNKFFNAQDCVGFFSRAIWMGLFSTGILLIILLFGTLMVLNLSVMDKFDDPKGKTITVAQAND